MLEAASSRGDRLTDVSIVIPTMNRAQDLSRLLNSILQQTRPPKEVTIVDDSDNSETMKMTELMRSPYKISGITLRYVRGSVTRRSISLARNIGASQSSMEIITFLDDDVVIDKEYLDKITQVFDEYPHAIGVQGYLGDPEHFNTMANSLNKLFFLHYRDKQKCGMLRSTHISYPYSVSYIMNCEWLSGTNSSYRKNILENFKFDENLTEYSLGEDVDISYRIHKCHPNTLYLTPYAKVVHLTSPRSRRRSDQLTYINAAYRVYLFCKNARQTRINKMICIWSLFGQFITTFLFFFKGEPRSRILASLLRSNAKVVRHLSLIREGSF